MQHISGKQELSCNILVCNSWNEGLVLKFMLSITLCWTQVLSDLQITSSLELGITNDEKSDGIQQGKVETSKNLLTFDITIEKIIEATGLKYEEVENLIC